MKQFFLLGFLALAASGCASVQPYIADVEDPFTGAKSRIMTIGESRTYKAFTALADASYAMNPGIYRPVQSSPLPRIQSLGIIINARDTLLTIVKSYPEKGYDIPEDSDILVRFYDTKNNQFPVATLPLVKKYHTREGALIASGYIHAKTLNLLQRGVIDIVRIDKVSTNESDLAPIDWYLPSDYAKAFQKGSVMLFEQKESRPRKEPKEPAPKKKKK
jgi:hypothetical protein